MENVKENARIPREEEKPEWVKPEVSVFDVVATTLVGTAGAWDGGGYS